MELSKIRTDCAHRLIKNIRAELAERGVPLRQRNEMQKTTAGGYANCYILDGTFAGGLITVSLTKQLDELEVTWGPYFLPQHGLQYVSFRAYSFEALVKRLNKETKRAASASNCFGVAAIETWFVWMYTASKQLQEASKTFREILEGERTSITIHNHLVQKLTPGMRAVLDSPQSKSAKAFLARYCPCVVPEPQS